MKEIIRKVYPLLLSNYGKQGWWPLRELKKPGHSDPLIRRGYHPGDYLVPENNLHQFEICLGVLLTQNTSWAQVETVLDRLWAADLIDPIQIASLDPRLLESHIRSCGYYRQKSKKITQFSQRFNSWKGRFPDREELLGLWGIGPESADSMLLYAFGQPSFVVDLYTCRLFSRLTNRLENNYTSVQSCFHDTCSPMTAAERLIFFNEYHALIVTHGKYVCRKRPLCGDCLLFDFCLWSEKQPK